MSSDGQSGRAAASSMLALILVSMIAMPIQASAGTNAEIVEEFLDAFTQHDVEAMLALAADDLHWMTLAGQRLFVETSDKNQLREAMEEYFASTPSARAGIRSITESGAFVHTVEEAFWESDGAEKSQCSMAVYELEEGKIRNVWYFPAYDCP